MIGTIKPSRLQTVETANGDLFFSFFFLCFYFYLCFF